MSGDDALTIEVIHKKLNHWYKKIKKKKRRIEKREKRKETREKRKEKRKAIGAYNKQHKGVIRVVSTVINPIIGNVQRIKNKKLMITKRKVSVVCAIIVIRKGLGLKIAIKEKRNEK